VKSPIAWAQAITTVVVVAALGGGFWGLHVFAVRVGALDGRHPEAGQRPLERIAAALAPGG
jgi:hypothetical protein